MARELINCNVRGGSSTTVQGRKAIIQTVEYHFSTGEVDVWDEVNVPSLPSLNLSKLLYTY